MNKDKIIFSTKDGWIYLTFQVEDEIKIKLSASYLDDIPLIWLNSISANLRDKIPFILKGDSEGSKFSIIESDEGLLVIIEDTGGYELNCFGSIFLPKISKKELIEEILSGIEIYLEEMIAWNSGGLSNENKMKRKKLILNKIEECNKYLKEGKTECL